jgi:hypothetical protein
MHDAHIGTVEATREPSHEMANLIQRADPIAAVRMALELPPSVDPLRRAVETAARLQPPMMELERQLNAARTQTAYNYGYYDLDAFHNAAMGITQILEHANPLLARPEQFAAATAFEQLFYEQQAADLFDSVFNERVSVVDLEAFERGVEQILASLGRIETQLERQLVSAFIASLLAGLLVMLLQIEIESRTHRAPAASNDSSQSTVVRDEQAATSSEPSLSDHFAEVTANVLNVRQWDCAESPAIAQIKRGQRIKIIENCGNWTKVESTNLGTEKDKVIVRGWVASRFIKPDRR